MRVVFHLQVWSRGRWIEQVANFLQVHLKHTWRLSIKHDHALLPNRVMRSMAAALSQAQACSDHHHGALDLALHAVSLLLLWHHKLTGIAHLNQADADVVVCFRGSGSHKTKQVVQGPEIDAPVMRSALHGVGLARASLACSSTGLPESAASGLGTL